MHAPTELHSAAGGIMSGDAASGMPYDPYPPLPTEDSDDEEAALLPSPTAAASKAVHAVSAGVLHPSRFCFRFIVLMLTCGLTFGGQVAYDSVGALAPYLKQSLSTSAEGIADLYSAYHFPNAITVIIGSVVTDAIGAGPTGVLCALAVVWGAAMVAASSSLADMMLGRVILGVGNESMNVVQFAMLSRWFSDSPSFPQLASAFSASVIIQKSGTIICFNLLPRFGLMRLHAALWSVAALCAVVVLGGALLLAWLNCLASPVLPHLRPQPPSDAEADQPRGLRGVLRRVSAFPRLYWLLAVIAVAYWSALIPFIDFSSDLFHEKWAYSPPAASRASSFIITTLLCFVPVSGHLADTYGHRVQLMLAGAALLVPVQCALALSKAMMPEVACVLIGISFALVSVPVYSCMSMVLPKQAAATGFGLAVALQNASMFAVPIAVGFLHDHSGSYTQALLLFALLASCATCACAAAAGEDVRTGGRLLSPSAGKQ